MADLFTTVAIVANLIPWALVVYGVATDGARTNSPAALGVALMPIGWVLAIASAYVR